MSNPLSKPIGYYIGIKPCGCQTMVSCDMGQDQSKFIEQQKKDGYKIEYKYTHEEAVKNLKSCKCNDALAVTDEQEKKE